MIVWNTSHTEYIWTAFDCYVSTSAFSNLMIVWKTFHTEYICRVFLHCVSADGFASDMIVENILAPSTFEGPLITVYSEVVV